MAKHKLYDNTPKIEHDDKGNTRVKKPEKKEGGDKEEPASGDAHSRHGTERKEMMTRHMKEYADMHERHEVDRKSIFTRHEKEAGATDGSTVGDSIEKIEKGAK